MKTANPIHVALIEGIVVRFWMSPPGGTDEPPWVALADLHRAMGQPDKDLALWTDRLANNDDSCSVLTDEGPIQIVSHVIASSVTAGLVSAQKAPLLLAHQYGIAFSEAVDALLSRLRPAEAAARKHRWLSESFDLGNAPRPPDGSKLS